MPLTSNITDISFVLRCVPTLYHHNYLLLIISTVDGCTSKIHLLQLYYYYNRFTALCPGLPGWAGTRRNIHPLTYDDHHPTFI